MKGLLREPLLHFVLLGGVLFAGSALLTTQAPIITISAAEQRSAIENWRDRHGSSPNTDEQNALLASKIDDAVLLAEAIQHDLHRRDPVVRYRLLQNIRLFSFGGPANRTDQQMLESALRMSMHRADLVARRRLIQQMRMLIESRVGVTEDELHAHYAAHPDDYRHQPRYDFELRFFPDGESLPPQPWGNLDAATGEPFLLGQRFSGLSHQRVYNLFGSKFQQAIATAPLNRWHGPLRSIYGQHLVRVTARQSERPAPFDDVRARVIAQVYAEKEQAAVARWLDATRSTYDIRIERRATGPS